MTSEAGDWTTPSQAEGERDDEEPSRGRWGQNARSTPSQAEGEREEREEGSEKKGDAGRSRSAG